MVTEIPVGNILARRSIRKYTDKPVSDEQIETLLKAAMAAPSAGNRKPWHFIVVTERAKLNELADKHPHGKMLYEAPLCIVVCGDPSLSFEGEGQAYWIQDCSAATENILLAATGLGLGSVWLGVHPRKEREKFVRETLSIPPNIVPLCLISIGHPAEEKEPRTQYDPQRVHYQKW
ncbi:MAG: nitroreductase family protein [bacterium]